MYRDETGWTTAYTEKDALFVHNGDMKRAHALLTSGNHSGLFFNSRLIIADEPLLREAASDLVETLILFGFPIHLIDRVVGPQTGATKLAEFISDSITTQRGYPCGWASPAKKEEGGEKKMVWDDPNRKVLHGERVLLCEDVVTTAGSVILARNAVVEVGGLPFGKILTLVNRSPSLFVGFDGLIALIRKEAPVWTPEDCKLCKEGSLAIPAKDPVNWAKLTAP